MLARTLVLLALTATVQVGALRFGPDYEAASPTRLSEEEAAHYKRAAVTTFPSAAGSSSLATPITVASGQVFDGRMWRYDRGANACTEQREGDDEDAVFLVQRGGTLRNVIIGKDQAEGVHCLGPCVIENVWWEDVCEDALTIKNDVPGDVSYVRGGGAKHAQDKMLQHNGCGHLDVRDFYGYDFGKLYRSCGDCSTMCRRTASFSGVIGVGCRDMFCGINDSYDDVCTVGNLITDCEDVCNSGWEFDGERCVQNGPLTSTSIAKPTSTRTSTRRTTTSTRRTTTRTPTSTRRTTTTRTAAAQTAAPV